MWFDIIKETESERLRRLGYDVPEEMDMASTINRQMIIDKIVDWVNNQKEISPFEQYFEIWDSRGLSENKIVGTHTKNVLVVEATTPRTNYFSDMTMTTRYNNETNETYREYKDEGNMNDTDVAKFFVGVYEVGPRTTPINELMAINDMDFNVKSIVPEGYFPRLRAGGFFNSAITMAGGKLDKDGRGWVLGNSGNKYIVDMKGGDSNILLMNKPVEFIDFPELNTTLKKINLCIHGSPELHRTPLGDRFAATMLGLKNDTALTGDALKIIQLIAKPWKFKLPSIYNEKDIKNMTSRSGYSLTEEGAARILGRDFIDEDGGYFNYWFL